MVMLLMSFVKRSTVVLAAIALSLSVGAVPKTMTKSFRIWGHVEGQVTGVTQDGMIVAELVDVGVTTHAGNHYNVFMSVMNPETGAGNSEGTWTAANGEEMKWKGTSTATSLTVMAVPGGTGRYANVEGSFTGEISNLEISETGAITYDYVGQGSITY